MSSHLDAAVIEYVEQGIYRRLRGAHIGTDPSTNVVPDERRTILSDSPVNGVWR